MDKKAPSSEKKRSLFWIVLIVLVMMMGALGWQAKSLLQKPEPAPAPSTVWAKVPPVPPPTTIQIPQSPPDATPHEIIDSQDEETSPSETGPPESGGKIAAEPSDSESPASGAAPVAPAEQAVEPVTTAPKALDEKIVQSVDEAVQAVKETTEALTPPPKAPVTAAETETTQPSQPAPEEATAPATASKQTAAPEKREKKQAPYTIQVGAFRVKAHATETVAKLARKGYQSYISETMSTGKKPWYEVRFGHFETLEQANRALSTFKTKEKLDGMVARSRDR